VWIVLQKAAVFTNYFCYPEIATTDGEHNFAVGLISTKNTSLVLNVDVKLEVTVFLHTAI